jgi:FMN-dependent NADH-azoreductase
MRTLLRIDASARAERSITRKLTRRFVDRWIARRPSDRVLVRDVGREPPPAVSEAWIRAAFMAEADRDPAAHAALAVSEALIEELSAADIVVIGTPMYNYGMPASLKAWVDQVVRVNRTFSFDLARGDFPIRPILTGKTLVGLISTGEFGFEPGGVRAGMDHLRPHLQTLAELLGFAATHFVGVHYQEFGGDRHRDSLAAAERAVDTLVDELAAPLLAAERAA